jgi:hypothetical protein
LAGGDDKRTVSSGIPFSFVRENRRYQEIKTGIRRRVFHHPAQGFSGISLNTAFVRIFPQAKI